MSRHPVVNERNPGTARCWAEIDLSALRHNLELARQQSPPGAGLMAVVKADAYGHGVLPVVKTLRDHVKWFAVANVTEAREILPERGEVPIILFGPVLPEERREVVRLGAVPMLSSLAEAREFAALADDAPTGEVAAHVKVDTGMGRMGLDEATASQELRQILALPKLRVTGLATHFPSSDDDPRFTRGQIRRFRELLDAPRADLPADLEVHCQNSAGILDYDLDRVMTLARPGLMLYGSSPNGHQQQQLRPVCTWKSRVVLTRDVPEGRTVSYGRTFTTPRPMRIATIGAGYADGYPRILSNRGARVLIGGQPCPLLGRVTMDLIMADVSRLPADNCRPGAEVVLMGRQGQEEISAADLAEKAETIAYEIFTGISARVPRVVSAR